MAGVRQKRDISRVNMLNMKQVTEKQARKLLLCFFLTPKNRSYLSHVKKGREWLRMKRVAAISTAARLPVRFTGENIRDYYFFFC